MDSAATMFCPYMCATDAMTTVGNSYVPSPATLKRTADMEMASGVNRFIVHTSVHQPLDSLMPGLSLGPFGQWFTRQETWADQARSWVDYLARTSHLLQQGRFVADVLYYYGENNATQKGLFDNDESQKYVRRDAISDFILERAKQQYGKTVTKEDIFYYVYGFLHSNEYRETFANDLKKMLPRLPLVENVKDFWAFSKAGRQLAELHLNYETVVPSPDVVVKGDDGKTYTIKAKKAFHLNDEEVALQEVFANSEIGTISAGELQIKDEGNHLIFSKNPVLILNK